MTRIEVTEYLDIDLDGEAWVCRECDERLVDATENYKTGCLVHERDPTEVHRPEVDGEYTFAPDPEWCRIVEFYCPGCGTMVENEYLPPGHPITHDIEIDLEAAAERAGADPGTAGEDSDATAGGSNHDATAGDPDHDAGEGDGPGPGAGG